MRTAVQGLLVALALTIVTEHHDADAALDQGAPVVTSAADSLQFTIFDPTPILYSRSNGFVVTTRIEPYTSEFFALPLVLAPALVAPGKPTWPDVTPEGALPKILPEAALPEAAPAAVAPQTAPEAATPAEAMPPAAIQHAAPMREAYAAPVAPEMESPKMGSPKMGSPKMGSPKMGSPKMGSLEPGSPIVQGPELPRRRPHGAVRKWPVPRTGGIEFDKPTLAPMGHTHFCLRYPSDCQVHEAPFGGSVIDLTEKRRAELERVNAHVNRSIRPMRMQETIADEKWLIAPKVGDCNDYAVTKRHELLALGWPANSLLLAEVVTTWGEHHLVLVVRTSEGDLVADSLDKTIRNWSTTPYRWVRVEMPSNPMFWASIKAPRPGMVVAQRDRRARRP